MAQLDRIPRNPEVAWRTRAFGVLRILFGAVWAVDAAFKWQPSFIAGFVSYLTGAQTGQPPPVKAWISFWIDIVKVDPTFFAYVVAGAETALAAALLLGLFSNVAYLGGMLLCLVIWSTAEGLGGPYTAGSTDIGTAIIYVFVFVALFLAQAGLAVGLDRLLAPLLGRWAWLASGDRTSG